MTRRTSTLNQVMYERIIACCELLPVEHRQRRPSKPGSRIDQEESSAGDALKEYMMTTKRPPIRPDMLRTSVACMSFDAVYNSFIQSFSNVTTPCQTVDDNRNSGSHAQSFGLAEPLTRVAPPEDKAMAFLSFTLVAVVANGSRSVKRDRITFRVQIQCVTY